MATNKVGLTKLNLKKNTDIISIEWNNQNIEIKCFLPTEEKLGVVGRIVSLSLDENNFLNPMRFDIFETLELMYAYTNINFTDKQKEDVLGLYDLLVSSGLWNKIYEKLYEIKEYQIIHNSAKDLVNEIYKYRDSALGILDSINQDYKDVNYNVDKIQEVLGDKQNLSVVKDIVTKLG